MIRSVNLKKNPYAEIIDLDKELKEYKKLCRCRSKKFAYYTDWEKYICKLLEKFETDIDLYNFKRYCMNYGRTATTIPGIYINIMILYITIFIDKCVTELNFLVWLFIMLLSVILILAQNISYNNEDYFYKDIIEIIESLEK